MTLPEKKLNQFEWADVARIRWETVNRSMSVDVVSAFAGDRHLTESEKALLDDLEIKWREGFYTLILYILTHQHFNPDIARDLWNSILKHKYEMSVIMNRNIRITVAALDYLTNLTDEIRYATVIDEDQITSIIQLSLRDGLTGLFNHTSCYQKIDMELGRFTRYETPVSFMMIDIDNFKEINDRFGHTEGDKILVMLGSLILRVSRDADICCRYGGEEFAVIMPSTEVREAVVLAERLRNEVENCLTGGRKITVSIGVASAGGGVTTSLDLVQKADSALYRAKGQGKNCVCMFE